MPSLGSSAVQAQNELIETAWTNKILKNKLQYSEDIILPEKNQLTDRKQVYNLFD